MANYKTINLTGSEIVVEISGQNCDIRNDGTDIVYISRRPLITAGADGVMSVPAGQAAKLLDSNGTAYLTGTGTVLLCGNDYSELVFKVAATSSDEGGTSNRNLLINGNMKINQRGKAEYTNEVGPDGWLVRTVAKVEYIDGKAVISASDKFTANNSLMVRQDVKGYDGETAAGKKVTLSLNANASSEGFTLRLWAFTADGNTIRTNLTKDIPAGESVQTITTTIQSNAPYLRVGISAPGITGTGGESITINDDGFKLEIGDHATPVRPASYTEELIRCQRYYQLRTTGDIAPADLHPTMATITDIKERSDGLYEYIAED